MRVLFILFWAMVICYNSIAQVITDKEEQITVALNIDFVQYELRKAKGSSIFRVGLLVAGTALVLGYGSESIILRNRGYWVSLAGAGILVRSHFHIRRAEKLLKTSIDKKLIPLLKED